MKDVRDPEKMTPRLRRALAEYQAAQAELERSKRAVQKLCRHRVVLFQKTKMHDHWNERPARICVKCRLYEFAYEWSDGNWWLWSPDDEARPVTGELCNDPKRTIIVVDDVGPWRIP